MKNDAKKQGNRRELTANSKSTVITATFATDIASTITITIIIKAKTTTTTATLSATLHCIKW